MTKMNIPWEQFRLWLNKKRGIAEVEVPVTRRSVKLFLIRHGESEMNTSPELICGRSNSSELTNRGWEEALALGTRLKKLGVQPDEIYSSPAVRTIQTANITLEQMGLTEKPVERPELQEISMGEWTGPLGGECNHSGFYPWDSDSLSFALGFGCRSSSSITHELGKYFDYRVGVQGFGSG